MTTASIMKDSKSAKFVPAKRCSCIVNIRKERKILARYQVFYKSARALLAATTEVRVSLLRLIH